MSKTRVSGFCEGEAVRLESGAIITPILRKGGRDSEALINYLCDEARNPKCEFSDMCIDALQKISYCVGFSCQRCPLNT